VKLRKGRLIGISQMPYGLPRRKENGRGGKTKGCFGNHSITKLNILGSQSILECHRRRRIMRYFN